MKTTIAEIKSEAIPHAFDRYNVTVAVARSITAATVDGHRVALVSVRDGVAQLSIKPVVRQLAVGGVTYTGDQMIAPTKSNSRNPSELFWSLWKSNKAELKRLDLGVMKVDRRWIVGGSLGTSLDGDIDQPAVADVLESKIAEGEADAAYGAKIESARKTGKPNPASERLVALKTELDAIGEDYKHPRRNVVIGEYFAEMRACGKIYCDERLDTYALKCGNQFGEDTMLDLLAEAGGNIAVLEINIEESSERAMDDAEFEDAY